MTDRTALTVTQVLQRAKAALEPIRVTVVGEVSEVTDRPGYKAVYFSLCDGDSVLPCLVWRSDFESVDVTLQNGVMVEASGFLTVYAAKGRLQFQVRGLTIAGEGVLRMQVAALASKLQAEGLMASERKRPLPAFPERIGVVTSPRGKAVHDVIRTLHRRYPVAEVVLAGIQVEGRGAAGAIVDGIEAVSEAGVDVVIVCRGGGSYEDMMPFNDETVARAIVSCPVPVVTGIGHEPDTCIADMVADTRASTPTAAAEAVAESVDQILHRLRHASGGLARGLSHAAVRARGRLEAIAARPVLSEPRALLSGQAQRVDQAADALARALPGRLEKEGMRLDALADRLNDLSPLGILGRGYAICFDDGGRAVRSAGSLSLGARVAVRFARGSAGCVVDSVDMEG